MVEIESLPPTLLRQPPVVDLAPEMIGELAGLLGRQDER